MLASILSKFTWSYIHARLLEPSTYRGIVRLIMATGVIIYPDIGLILIAMGQGINGAIGITTPDSIPSPIPDSIPNKKSIVSSKSVVSGTVAANATNSSENIVNTKTNKFFDEYNPHA